MKDPSKARRIALGLEKAPFSLADIQARAQQTVSEYDAMLEQLRNGSVKALRVEGDFGSQIRQQVYDQMGFHTLRGDTYPHHDEAPGLLPDALNNAESNFGSLAEQLYANYVAHRDRFEMYVSFARITAEVIASAVLILVANAAGAAVAGLFFAEATPMYVATEITVGAFGVTAGT